ncbi:hypothetical protein [Thiomonas sp. X19]|uniref:KUP/HAK/KT family potassium transporter n=1 Tax=Thiomonas sp. X19 TaxID=1050370 RepID=UPI00352AF3B2
MAYTLHAQRGFQDAVDIQGLFANCAQFCDFEFQMNETSFFLAPQTLVSARRKGLHPGGRSCSPGSTATQAASDYFKIPPNQAVELGTQIEISICVGSPLRHLPGNTLMPAAVC